MEVALQALKDFQDRIAKYEEVYETITDRSLHYIKLIDMCVCCEVSSQASIGHTSTDCTWITDLTPQLCI